VGLVAGAYLWAMLGALLLMIDGGSLLATGSALVAFDAVRHSFAIGFIALLICGIAPRMLPSFSGGKIVSPKLVSATRTPKCVAMRAGTNWKPGHSAGP
jgi:uncharacterized protein involved in response to NO